MDHSSILPFALMLAIGASVAAAIGLQMLCYGRPRHIESAPHVRRQPNAKGRFDFFGGGGDRRS